MSGVKCYLSVDCWDLCPLYSAPSPSTFLPSADSDSIAFSLSTYLDSSIGVQEMLPPDGSKKSTWILEKENKSTKNILVISVNIFRFHPCQYRANFELIRNLKRCLSCCFDCPCIKAIWSGCDVCATSMWSKVSKISKNISAFILNPLHIYLNSNSAISYHLT